MSGSYVSGLKQASSTLDSRKVAMSVVRVGSTKKFADGWENIFGGSGKKSAAKKVTSGKKAKSKPSPKKRASKISTPKQGAAPKKRGKPVKTTAKSTLATKKTAARAKKRKPAMQQKVLF
jgi:hypothetical protein